MKGFKVFNNDWTCRGYQYKVGQTYEMDGEPQICNKGFHFCTKVTDCFSYYKFDPCNKIAEVEALGKVEEGADDSKVCTNKIRIVREITWQELLAIANVGNGCKGYGNTGDWNTGDRNTGNRNTGNGNTGDWNTGNGNTGNRNTGDWNTGNGNTGDRNTGNRNTGDGNTGYWNTGNRNAGDGNTGYWNTGNGNTGNWNTGNRNAGNGNTGDWNTGNRNTGDWNTGNRNTGNGNTGDWNTGNGNTGNRNTGDWNTGNGNTGDRNTGNGNTGDWNTGDWNTANHSNGCFNTEEQKIHLFNKPSNWTYQDWLGSDACRLMNRIDSNVLEYIDYSRMTDEEKEQYPTAKTTGGYLKELDASQNAKIWWEKLTKIEKDIIKAIPNFDPEIFREITGIEV